MTELQIAAEKSWIIISTCIIVVMAVGAVAVLVWWFVTNFTNYEKNIRRESNEKTYSYAAAADIGWSNYIDMKKKFEESEENRAKERELAEKWDKKRFERICTLEKQLRDNGIDPIPFSGEEVGETA